MLVLALSGFPFLLFFSSPLHKKNNNKTTKCSERLCQHTSYNICSSCSLHLSRHGLCGLLASVITDYYLLAVISNVWFFCFWCVLVSFCFQVSVPKLPYVCLSLLWGFHFRVCVQLGLHSLSSCVLLGVLTLCTTRCINTVYY